MNVQGSIQANLFLKFYFYNKKSRSFHKERDFFCCSGAYPNFFILHFI
jgi:hypothetical protein